MTKVVAVDVDPYEDINQSIYTSSLLNVYPRILTFTPSHIIDQVYCSNSQVDHGIDERLISRNISLLAHTFLLPLPSSLLSHPTKFNDRGTSPLNLINLQELCMTNNVSFNLSL